MNKEVDVEIVKSNQNDNPIEIGEYYLRIEDCLSGSDKIIEKENKERLREESEKIVKRLNYSGDTGLIIGRIQSGKTLSFEAVSSLARDNGTPLIIILAGISKILSGQTLKRIKRDFDIEHGARFRWEISTTPLKQDFNGRLKDSLELWHDPEAEEHEKKATVIIAMKHYAHINSITKELNREELKDVLKDTKTLIIDDEADQHSLNAKTERNSDDIVKLPATNKAVLDLRECLPKHTFLQYTATPAANFLIDIIDPLTPDFAENINPGNGYIGVETIFEKDSEYTNVVNFDEELESMPDDLKDALAIFLLGVKAGIKNSDGGHRSMLVHPSRLISDQTIFYNWINSELETWKNFLKSANPNDKKPIERIFREAYDNLSRTVSDLPPFSDMFDKIERVINGVNLELINSGPSSTSTEIDWEQNYAWILVSGQAVDRGTTVEGLTVTYMPRNTSFQTDTQTQRARFCGYKEKYLGYVRVYAEKETIDFYEKYSLTEDDFRDLVSENSGNNFKNVMREWKIKRGFKSCRPGVIKLGGAIIITGTKQGRWTYPRVPHNKFYKENNRLIENFVEKFDFVDAEGNDIERRSNQQKHLFTIVPYKELFNEVLVDLRYPDHRDQTAFSALTKFLMSMYHHSEVDEKASVYMMAPKGETREIKELNRKLKGRERSTNEQNQIRGFFQGASPDNKSATTAVPYGSVYPGDRSFVNPENFTLQIHTQNIRNNENTYIENIKNIAIKLPNRWWEEFDLQTQQIIVDEDTETFEEF